MVGIVMIKKTVMGKVVLCVLTIGAMLLAIRQTARAELVTKFTKIFGSDAEDIGYSIIQTREGDYLVAGASRSFGQGDWDIIVSRLDAFGNLLWTKTFRTTEDEVANKIIQTSDDGFLIVGGYRSGGLGYLENAGNDILALKLDKFGNIEWVKTFVGQGFERAFDVVQTSDGGYALAGYTTSFGVGGLDALILKLNSGGDVQFSKTYGGVGGEVFLSIYETFDGGFILSGNISSETMGAGGVDAFVVKTDALGNLVFSKAFGGLKDENAHDIRQLQDGSFVLVGRTFSFSIGQDDILFLKLDPFGALQFAKTFGTTGSDGGFSIIQTLDWGYAVVGNLFLKIDWAGVLDFAKAFGGFEIIQTSDAGFAIVDGITDIIIQKLDPEGNDCILRDVSVTTLTPYVIETSQNVAVQESNFVEQVPYFVTILQSPFSFDFCPLKLTVSVDIKPGSYPNSINLKSKGVIPVAVLGYINFDVTQINTLTVRFGPAQAIDTDGRAVFEDVNQDGFIDAVFHFKTQDTGISNQDIKACLSGALLNNIEFLGCDSIRVVH